MNLVMGCLAAVAFGGFALIDLLAGIRALYLHHYGEMGELFMNAAGLILCAGSFYWISVKFDSPPIPGFALLFLGITLSGVSGNLRYRREKHAQGTRPAIKGS